MPRWVFLDSMLSRNTAFRALLRMLTLAAIAVLGVVLLIALIPMLGTLLAIMLGAALAVILIAVVGVTIVGWRIRRRLRQMQQSLDDRESSFDPQDSPRPRAKVDVKIHKND